MRLIDADEFESYLIGRYGGNDTAEDIIEDLHKQPTVSPDMAQYLAYECGKKSAEDAVSVVRCRDCKYFADEGMYCANDIIVQFDHFFCYYGERKSENLKPDIGET